jgi:NAD(P)-dependent dehydrogenase (short-subunit alcohol dehydrogenase family)
MDFGLDGRVALITGAGRNIGRSTARLFARHGVDLVLCTRRNADQLAEAAEEARGEGVRVLAELCDVSSAADVARLAAQAEETFGRVDILVNNATQRVHGKFFDLTPDQWSQVIAVNLTGPYLLCQALMPAMVENRWGRIISYSGNSAYRGGGASTATVKLGIVGFTRSLAKEFGKHNITANCIAPGSIATERTSGTERQSDRLGVVNDDVPIPRFGTQEEVASLVVYLASEPAGYITGQCVPINGGVHFL